MISPYSKNFDVPRSMWAVALKEHSLATLKSALEGIIDQFEITHLKLPESGLYLVQMRDSVEGEPYNLGEVPVSMCAVRLTHKTDETKHEGGTSIMGDCSELAETIAICDAVLANYLGDVNLLQDLVINGIELIQLRERKRKGILNKTMVDFNLLSQVDGEEDEDDY